MLFTLPSTYRGLPRQMSRPILVGGILEPVSKSLFVYFSLPLTSFFGAIRRLGRWAPLVGATLSPPLQPDLFASLKHSAFRKKRNIFEKVNKQPFFISAFPFKRTSRDGFESRFCECESNDSNQVGHCKVQMRVE